MSFSKATRAVNRVEIAVERADPNAERYLFEARQLVGPGKPMEQAYLDAYEGKLRHSRGEMEQAVACLERALATAFERADRLLGLNAGRVLVQLLIAHGRPDDGAALVNDIEEQWGEAPEVHVSSNTPVA
jgi:hypothetical protein